MGADGSCGCELANSQILIYRLQRGSQLGTVKGAFRTAAKRPADYRARGGLLLTTARTFPLIVNTRTSEILIWGGNRVAAHLLQELDVIQVRPKRAGNGSALLRFTSVFPPIAY